MQVVNKVLNVSIVLLLLLGMAFTCFVIWELNYSLEAQKDRIRLIYKQLVVQTGQSQDALPLVISDENIDNAYNDGTQVVYFMGLYNHAQTWDEVAMVLSHEIAHGMLGHLNMPLNELKPGDIAVLEGNADKMGALYMMKAQAKYGSGFDVCKGRLLFEYWADQNGDALGQDHPPYSYRIDQLNIGCE